MRIQIASKDTTLIEDFIGVESVIFETDEETTISIRIKQAYVARFIKFLTGIKVETYTVTGSVGLQWISFVLPAKWNLRI